MIFLSISDKDLGMVYSKGITSDKEEETQISPQNLNMLKEDYLKLLYLRQKILTNNFSH